MSGRHILMKL
jgi:hypothetical protein